MPHLEAIVIHCQDPGALARFYAEILGLPVSSDDEAAIAAGILGEDESVLLGSRDALHVWLTPVRSDQSASADAKAARKTGPENQPLRSFRGLLEPPRHRHPQRPALRRGDHPRPRRTYP